jgi:hypothetical protein
MCPLPTADLGPLQLFVLLLLMLTLKMLMLI